MHYVGKILQILWGLHYLVFGLNKLFIFQPVAAANPFAQQVIDSFYNTGYLMQTVGIFQCITGLMLLLNKYVSLAVLVAFPITLNIFLYTIFTVNYNVGSVATGLLVIIANVHLLVKHKSAYKTLWI